MKDATKEQETIILNAHYSIMSNYPPYYILNDQEPDDPPSPAVKELMELGIVIQLSDANMPKYDRIPNYYVLTALGVRTRKSWGGKIDRR